MIAVARGVLSGSGMTNRLLILALAVAASACASRPLRPTSPVRYACGETTITRAGDALIVRGAATTRGWTDREADHFVVWPHATTDVEAVEYVVPHDARKDAIVKRYDASAGYASSDWRLLEQRVCRAHGGYNDVLARWMNGESLDKVAADLDLGDRTAARTFVRKALTQLQKQYQREW